MQRRSSQEKQLRIDGGDIKSSTGIENSETALISELFDVDLHDVVEEDEIA